MVARLALLLLVVSCGSSSQPAAVAPGRVAAKPAGEPASGSAASAGPETGFEDTRWQMGLAELRQSYPRAPLAEVRIAGLEGLVELRMVDQLLASITVTVAEEFASMDSCGPVFDQVRRELDDRFGPSQSDNLAAYWSTPASQIVLACNPDADENGATMTIVYNPRGTPR